MRARSIDRGGSRGAPCRTRHGRRPKWRALAVPALLALLLAGGAGSARAAADSTAAAPLFTTTDEYKLKAAYLFNFAKYVEWPAARLPRADSPIVIGVLGTDPFGSRLDRTVKNRTIGRHRVVVRRARDLEDLAGCHLLFVCRSERHRETAILESLRGSPVLTIAEGDAFLREGGMIWLGRVGDAVEFDVNLDAVREAGLAIGARMLGSARHVAGTPDGRGH